MTDTLPLALTGFNYLADINTGMRRTAADTQAIECGGVDIAEFSTTGMSVAGNLDATAVKQNGVILLPVGVVLPYGGSTEPSGWLFCYGQSLLRASYPALFTAIGTAYGAADGTHFSLPDLRGRIPAGRDDMGGSAAGRLTSTTMSPDGNTLAATGGDETSTLAQSNLPNVNFTVSGITLTNGAPTISALTTSIGGVAGSTSLQGTNSGATGAMSNPGTIVATNVSVNTQGSAASGGSSSPFSNVQPSIIANYIIFAGV